jgi:cobalt-zinc-cadmium efflux system protein
MGGAHHHGPKPRSGTAEGNLGAAFGLNLLFACIELAGGIVTGSTAIIADAVHDFGDSLTLAMAWILQRFAGRGRSPTFTYGYARLSLLSSLLSGAVLLAGSILVLAKALPTLLAGGGQPHGWGMLGLAVLGVAVNGIAWMRLSKGLTRNEKMLSWHLVEDLLGWVAVLVGSIVILISGWGWVDPLLAVGIALFIGFNVFRNLRETVLLFLQRVPEGFDVEALSSEVACISGVHSVHDVHAWTLDGEKNIVSMHLRTKGSLPDYRLIQEIRHEVSHRLAEKGDFHLTIEFEPEDSHCHERED